MSGLHKKRRTLIQIAVLNTQLSDAWDYALLHVSSILALVRCQWIRDFTVCVVTFDQIPLKKRKKGGGGGL